MEKKKTEFDIIVIGAGSGGLNVASFMNKAGFAVLLADKSDRSIGGDCLNFGCVPSKALIHVARIVKAGKESAAFGLLSGGAVDMAKVASYIKEKQDKIREGENAARLRGKGIMVELGEVKFAAKDAVSINGAVYKAKKIVIATGSRPRMLDIPGMESAPVYTNENIFSIDFLPKRIAVIGGGPIGIELGQAFGYLGSKVSVIHRGKRILEKEDEEISGLLADKLKGDGMDFYMESSPEGIENGNVLVVAGNNGRETRLDIDAVLVSIGRILNTEGLGLEAAGIETEGTRIKVNDYLQTTNKNVFLVGDVSGKHQFTHAAELHAGVVLRNFFSPLRRKLNNDHMAWVTYTDPEVATFGLAEAELKSRGIGYGVIKKTFEEDDRAIVDSATVGLLKIFISKDKKILGGTMIAKNAGELAQELMLANSAGLKAGALFRKVYPYPTASRINRKAISGYFSKGLTPFNKKVLRFLYH